MGTELALHLNKDHDLVVWNRTKEKTQTLAEAGAVVADSAAEAINADGVEAVVTSLFGPDTVREVIIQPRLIPEGLLWIDTTTVSPAEAEEFATAVPSYVAAPVVGTLGPAREGGLGVYVGTRDDALRQRAVEIVRPWAAKNSDRLKAVDHPAKAATGKLLANLALAVSAEGLLEALQLAEATGTPADEALDMLDYTGLAFIKNMKAPFVLGERETSPGDFTVDAIAKDARLMLATAEKELAAVRSALESLERQQEEGRGNHDFSAMLVNRS